MIKSMTGFGRCETAENNRKFTVEMKSVNHRYLDVNIKMPKKLNFFESAIRSELKNYISRGKVDLFITYEDFSENTSSVRYNKELAAEYLGYLKQTNPFIEGNIFKSVENVNLRTIIAYKEDGVKHHFLEHYDEWK